MYHTVRNAATVARVIQVYTTQRGDRWLFTEQARRWEREHLTPAQRYQVNRLTSQVARLRTVLDVILTVADELQGGTIEHVLGKSDEELALGALLGRPAPPKR